MWLVMMILVFKPVRLIWIPFQVEEKNEKKKEEKKKKRKKEEDEKKRNKKTIKDEKRVIKTKITKVSCHGYVKKITTLSSSSPVYVETGDTS